MSKEKQIESTDWLTRGIPKEQIEREKIAEILAQNFHINEERYDASDFEWAAHCLQTAGYRKQSEGEWIGKTDYAGYGYYCSNCNAVFTGENAEWIAKEHYYCPKCGAKMKGGAE